MFDNDVLNAVFILGLWVGVTALVSHERKGDSETVKTAKRVARRALTVTLVLSIVLAALALYLIKGVPVK
jgi:Na+-driven multidrug efflux pump